MKKSHSKAKLEAFFVEVAALTCNHDVLSVAINDGTVYDSAVVFPSKLGEALLKVDDEWYQKIPAKALKATRPNRRG